MVSGEGRGSLAKGKSISLGEVQKVRLNSQPGHPSRSEPRTFTRKRHRCGFPGLAAYAHPPAHLLSRLRTLSFCTLTSYRVHDHEVPLDASCSRAESTCKGECCINLTLFRDSRLVEALATLTHVRESSVGLRPWIAATPLDDESSRQTDRNSWGGGHGVNNPHVMYTSHRGTRKAKIDIRSSAGPDDLLCRLCFMSITCAWRVVSVAMWFKTSRHSVVVPASGGEQRRKGLLEPNHSHGPDPSWALATGDQANSLGRCQWQSLIRRKACRFLL